MSRIDESRLHGLKITPAPLKVLGDETQASKAFKLYI